MASPLDFSAFLSGGTPTEATKQPPPTTADDYAAFGMDPNVFGTFPQFSMPSFMQKQDWGDGPAIVEPSVSYSNAIAGKGTEPTASVAPTATSLPAATPTPGKKTEGWPSAAQKGEQWKPDPRQPVYSLYGSSVVSVQPDARPFGPENTANERASTDAFPPEQPSTPFDPTSLGLPASLGGNFPGLYSASGFDLMGVLARVAARPNPQIQVGPVDESAAFVVVDARKYDFPIVFASSSFTKLTGYENNEVIGKNCRFIQAPPSGAPVQQGSKRKYTDSNAVWHMKSHILAGKECQASVINYRKNGTPFINLVTIIPIVWDSDEIAYFVGFQVDLVEQPNAILEKMRDGTYVVNYSLLPGASMAPSKSLHSADADDGFYRGEHGSRPEPVVSNTTELLDIIGARGLEGLDDEGTRKAWYRSILDNSDDFIHVLSLKGAFLYVSPTCKRLLEYDESDLVGKSITTVCHPSDSIPVMRELKESGNAQGHPVVSLLYRARRKHSGYVWLEAQGKLHVEQGKGRKCVILVGRERPTYRMSWTDLNRAGGIGEIEFWTKLSMEGMCLYSTASVQGVLGFTDEEMVGTAFSQLSPTGAQESIRRAIQQAANGQPVSLRHQLKNRQGKLLDVVSNFFPCTLEPPPAGRLRETPTVPTVICQTNEAGSDARRRAINRDLPKLPRPDGLTSPSPTDDALTLLRPDLPHAESSDSGGSSAPSTYSAVPSTFKALKGHPSHENDNIFADLETTKTSSWQFELHQLKLTNKRLREELDTLESARKKRKKKLQAVQSIPPVPGVRSCANCGRSDSPEWRKGPSGARDLCNACGLRFSKIVSSSQSPTSLEGQLSSTGAPVAGHDMDAIFGARGF